MAERRSPAAAAVSLSLRVVTVSPCDASTCLSPDAADDDKRMILCGTALSPTAEAAEARLVAGGAAVPKRRARSRFLRSISCSSALRGCGAGGDGATDGADDGVCEPLLYNA
jgi:hypothetical protein